MSWEMGFIASLVATSILALVLFLVFEDRFTRGRRKETG